MDEDLRHLVLLKQDIFNNGTDLNLFLVTFCILILLYCSAMISGSEVAFFSIDPTKLKTEKNLSSISKIKKLLNKPNYLLATILISNNLVKVAIIVLSTYLTTH